MKGHVRDYLNIYTKAARLMGLKYKIINSYIYDIYYKNKSIRFFQATPDVNDSTAHALTDRKHHTNLFLEKKGIPVFKQRGFFKEPITEMVRFASKIGYPVIIKPVQGYGGEGIIANIQNPSQLKNAIKTTKSKYPVILIENFYHGFDHRILICRDKVLAVTKRFPAMVRGDGKSNIKQLIDKKNKKLPHPITVGQEVINKLNILKMNLESIPRKGQEVFLRERANAHLGGTTYNLDIKTVHPDYIKICKKAMTELNLVFAGFDFMTSDITKSYRQTGGAITEVNDNPGIYMQSRSADNPITDIAQKVLKELFKIK